MKWINKIYKYFETHEKGSDIDIKEWILKSYEFNNLFDEMEIIRSGYLSATLKRLAEKGILIRVKEKKGLCSYTYYLNTIKFK